MEDGRKYEQVRNPLTPEQIVAMKDRLVTLLLEIKTLREDKQQTSATLGDSIKKLQKKMEDMSQAISQGFEWVEEEVFEILDEPEPGQKTIMRVNKKLPLRIEPMTARDKQQTLGFETET